MPRLTGDGARAADNREQQGGPQGIRQQGMFDVSCNMERMA